MDSLRVKLRQCGRIASSMVEEYGSKAANVMMILNQADKIAAQLLYCMGGRAKSLSRWMILLLNY